MTKSQTVIATMILTIVKYSVLGNIKRILGRSGYARLPAHPMSGIPEGFLN